MAIGVFSVFGDVGIMIKPSANPGAPTAGASTMRQLYVDRDDVLEEWYTRYVENCEA